MMRPTHHAPLASRRTRAVLVALGTITCLWGPAAHALIQANTTTPAPAGAAAASQDSAGGVAPGDRLILRVWREPSWSDSIVVSTNGMIVLPRVGSFRAEGLTPIALTDSIRARLAVYLREPVIDLVVLRRVAVLGSVKKPGVYFVDPVTTLREVVAQAAGADEEGDLNRIEVVRDGERRRMGKWNDVAESTAPIRSGDQVIVGKRPWFSRNMATAISSIAVAASVLVTAFRR
ncbi:MAG: polysaccharide biosynthesis/export family protein [Gemmatirosa sp.]